MTQNIALTNFLRHGLVDGQRQDLLCVVGFDGYCKIQEVAEWLRLSVNTVHDVLVSDSRSAKPRIQHLIRSDKHFYNQSLCPWLNWLVFQYHRHTLIQSLAK